MKSYIKIFMPVVLAILVGSLTFVFAQSRKDGQFPKGEGREGFRPPLPDRAMGGIPSFALEKLNLTDAQKEQIKTLEENSRTASKNNFEQIRTYDEQLKTMLDGGIFDEDQARQILTGKAQIMTEMQIARLKTDFAIRNILTAEQKAQLETLKQQRPEMPRGFRPDMPPPPQN